MCDPFLLADIDKAIARIREALDKNERIVIYGDYDVDGVTAVSTLYLYLKSKGHTVFSVADEWMTDIRHMSAYLMSSAG